MDRESFLSLPITVQIRMIFDALDEDASRFILNQDKPKIPFSPKYDFPIYRSGGIMWASETAAEGLHYWRKKYQQSADSGSEYAAKDAKKVAVLEKWIAWRECFPDATWSGERNDRAVTAKPPSTRPEVYQREGGGQRREPPPQDEGVDMDSDVPF
jgi:hypothetical protein